MNLLNSKTAIRVQTGCIGTDITVNECVHIKVYLEQECPFGSGVVVFKDGVEQR